VLRHEFQPGRLVAGAFLTLVGIIYAGDAGGAWETPWFAGIPVVIGGLFLAGAVSTVTGIVRKRRGQARPAGTTSADPQPDA
jgi:hypothetical protein